MKKINYSLIIISLFTLNFNVKAQSFEKGSFHIDLGLSVGLYATSQTITQEVTFFGFTQSETFDTTDATASFIVPISLEYGISNKFGVGLDLTSNSHFIDEEDKDELNSVKSFDFGVRVNYHLLNSDKNDLMIGFGLGFSSINWDFNTASSSLLENYSGSGGYWTIGITDRIFFSNHIGILFNLSYKNYNYSNLDGDFSSEGQALVNSLGSFKQEFDWKLNGVNVGFGLAFKL